MFTVYADVVLDYGVRPVIDGVLTYLQNRLEGGCLFTVYADVVKGGSLKLRHMSCKWCRQNFLPKPGS